MELCTFSRDLDHKQSSFLNFRGLQNGLIFDDRNRKNMSISAVNNQYRNLIAERNPHASPDDRLKTISKKVKEVVLSIFNTISLSFIRNPFLTFAFFNIFLPLFPPNTPLYVHFLFGVTVGVYSWIAFGPMRAPNKH